MNYNRENPPYYLSAYAIAVKHGYTGTEEEWNNAVNAARVAAETAQAAAETAQGKSETAQSKAETAQAAAETAQVKAEDAQEASEKAQGLAEDAQDAAEKAQGLAETAQEKAETAQSKAETAQSKAEAAQTAAETAQSKAEAAQTAAETAQGKAEDAQDAAEAAQTAAETAEGKAEAVAESIPEDYTELSNDVGELKEDLDTLTKEIYALTWNDNGYVNGSDIITNANNKYTNFVSLVNGDTVAKKIFFKRPVLTQWIPYSFFSDTAYISGGYAKSETDLLEVISVPANATRIRISADNSVYSKCSIGRPIPADNEERIAENEANITEIDTRLSNAENSINYNLDYESTEYTTVWNDNGYVNGSGIVTNANNKYTDFIETNGATQLTFIRPNLSGWINYALFNGDTYIAFGYIKSETDYVETISLPSNVTKFRFSTANSCVAKTKVTSISTKPLKNRVTELEEEVSCLDIGNVTLTLDGSNLQFDSTLDTHSIRLTAQKANTRADSNPIFNFLYYYLDGELFKDAEDDITPINITQPDSSNTYIGGGHGFSNGLKLTTTVEKEAVDIGSVWRDANGNDFVLYNIGSGYVKVVNATIKTIVSPLTHVNGATNTDSIVFTASEMSFIIPAVNNHYLSIADYNGNAISDDGSYISKWFDVIESYDILDPVGVISYLKANVGNCTNDSVIADDIKKLCKVNLVYRIANGCSCTVYQSIDSIEDVHYAYAGFVQAMPIGSYIYVPDAFDNEVKQLSGTTIDIAKTNWNSQAKVPYRYLQFKDSNYSCGFFIGYYPTLGTAKNDARLTKCSNAGMFYSSKKMYPYLINSATYTSGSTVEAICFRTPFLKQSNGSIATTYNYIGDDIIMCIDYQDAYNGFITINDDCVGRKVEVIDKTDTITFAREIVSSTKMPIIATGKGYAVVRFYK